ncbi:hypothetical protein [Methylotuvimicrobium alcaliphilum]|uniref:Uncharacterized protein n=1 Tax=Methylotuvimicrobium alcaliphilum (strain DSM 19304 / NCIMB 14124 / VKM B-2133 / 20Z) TaxID=1091494 RepID=G4T278_META2|nr:hypothetical protein [Methylotuvimicrobium alcaliphilum]CCE22504.1 exported protein of unknown function [Methylotuvimicrobium alcaliphilum 20Z]
MHAKSVFFVKTAVLTAYLVGNTTWAHDLTGNLESPAGIENVYTVTCANNSTRMEARLRATSGPTLVLHIEKDGLSNETSTPASGFSPMIAIPGGGGGYTVSIRKFDDDFSLFALEYHCQNETDHTETSLLTVKTNSPIANGDNGGSTPPPNGDDGGNTTPDLSSSFDLLTESTISEGENFYGGIGVHDSCQGGTGNTRVMGHSVLFPTQNPRVTRVDTAANVSLDSVLTIGSLANLPQLIQSNSLSARQSEKTDANNNVIGFNHIRTRIAPGLEGLIPFRLGRIQFKPESCAKNLIIQLAVAEICRGNAFPPQPGTANLWIPSTTSRFNNNSIHGIGEAPTLTVQRNLTANPLPGTCALGYDVLIEPSSQDIDNNLPITRFWN